MTNNETQLLEALRDLYAEVEMAESIGICLPSRVPSLRAGDLLARLMTPNKEKEDYVRLYICTARPGSWREMKALRRLSARKRYREALTRIAGTPNKNSSEEAKEMARAASDALSPNKEKESCATQSQPSYSPPSCSSESRAPGHPPDTSSTTGDTTS